MKKYNAQDFLSHGRNLNLTYKFEALSGELLYQISPTSVMKYGKYE